MEIFVGFHFFRQHANFPRRVFARQPQLVVGRGRQQIHLDEIRQRHQGLPVRVVQEIVERQKIAELFQPPAGRQNFVVNFDGLQHLQHYAVFGKHGGEITDQEIARAVYERPTSRSQPVNSEK